MRNTAVTARGCARVLLHLNSSSSSTLSGRPATGIFKYFSSAFSPSYAAPCITHSARCIHTTSPWRRSADSALTTPKSAVSPSRSAPGQDDFPYPVQRLQLVALRQLYMHFVHHYQLKVPPQGILLDVGYIDTGDPRRNDAGGGAQASAASGDCPTVLVLHGAGGTHREMGGIIQALACDGARVLCPNFPGYGPTPMDEDMAYSHSLIENCNFLLDFLVKLGVMKVDLIVAFSAGGYPAVPLAIKSEYPVGGLALIQLPGHRVGRVMRPFWLKKALIRAMTRKWVRRLLTPINQLVMRNDGWKAIQSIEHTYIMGLTGIGVPFDNYEKVSAELPFSQLPLLLTFSEDDKFIDASIAYDYAEVVGVPRDHLTVYNREGQIVHRGRPVVNDTQYVRGMVFQKGGHFAQTRQPFAAVIEDAVVDIYRHIQRRKKREGIMTVRAEREA